MYDNNILLGKNFQMDELYTYILKIDKKKIMKMSISCLMKMILF